MALTQRLRAGSVIALACAMAAATLTAVATPAAADTPPWEAPGVDPNAVGTITFYDSTGAVVTSGSTDTAPFAAYAVGSVYPHAGDTQAGLYFANPDPASQPFAWYKEQVGLFTTDPITSGPTNVKTLSETKPVAAGLSGDETLDTFESDSVISTTAGYQNVVQVRLRSADASNTIATPYDTADLMINPATHTWTQIYPTGTVTPPTATKTTLKASPTSAVQGKPVKLTATETPKAAGTVQFKDGSKKLGGAVTVKSGVATLTTKALGVGKHSLSAVFTPSDTSAYKASTGKTTVTIKVAQHASTLTIAGPKSVKKGKVARITGKLGDKVTHKGIGRQAVTLLRRPKAGKPFRKVKVVHSTAAGAVSLRVKMTATAQFEWKYAGTAAHKGVTSKIKVVRVHK